MARIIDYVSVRFAIFMLLLIWCNYFFDSIFVAAAVAVSVFIVICIAVEGVKSKSTRKKFYSSEKFTRQLAIMGSEYALQLYADSYELSQTISGNKLYTDDTLYFSAVKFGSASADDVASAFRSAIEKNMRIVKIICRDASRDASLLAESLPLDVTFIKSHYIYKRLRSQNKLPPLLEMKKSRLKGLSIKNMLANIFSTNNTRYYIFSGGILSVMSLITPMRLYYLIMSSVSFVMAVSTIVYTRFIRKQ